ncbi:MAG TPA: hypothetical protein VF892_21140, partial [Pseudonocardiaceae bacterium]
DRDGRLVAAPSAADECVNGVSLVYRPLRDIGGDRPLTNTNRDYLGVLRSVGTEQATVDRAAAAYLAGLKWDIQA